VTREGDRCPDNLLARSRRGPLSPVERRALDAHLSGCALCRSTVALGAIYDDAPDDPQAGDDAVIAGLASRVVGGLARRRRLRPSWAASVAAALGLLVVAGAAAAWVASRPRASAPPAAVLLPQRGTTSHAAPPVVAPAASPKVVDRPKDELRAPVAGPRGHAVRRPPLAHAAVPADAPPGPAELFAAANAARRAGDLRDAISRYGALDRRYPASPEAGVARVSAGDLLLRLGEPAAALEQFDGYLGAHGSEPLGPEALFGRARCLRALGRTAEERAAWEELSRRFPGSVYEPSGRRRLEELGR